MMPDYPYDDTVPGADCGVFLLFGYKVGEIASHIDCHVLQEGTLATQRGVSPGERDDSDETSTYPCLLTSVII